MHKFDSIFCLLVLEIHVLLLFLTWPNNGCTFSNLLYLLIFNCAFSVPYKVAVHWITDCKVAQNWNKKSETIKMNVIPRWLKYKKSESRSNL